MNKNSNRLLMELERVMRSINHEVINPQINELSIDDLRPVLGMVAHARARYLKALFALGANEAGIEERPSQAQFEDLRALRAEYDELINGARALETAIQRGYLDVKSSAQ
jgi:hypothetical protein